MFQPIDEKLSDEIDDLIKEWLFYNKENYPELSDRIYSFVQNKVMIAIARDREKIRESQKSE